MTCGGADARWRIFEIVIVTEIRLFPRTCFFPRRAAKRQKEGRKRRMAYLGGHVPAVKMRGFAPNFNHSLPINGQYIHQYVAAHAGSVLRSPTGSIQYPAAVTFDRIQFTPDARFTRPAGPAPSRSPTCDPVGEARRCRSDYSRKKQMAPYPRRRLPHSTHGDLSGRGEGGAHG